MEIFNIMLSLLLVNKRKCFNNVHFSASNGAYSKMSCFMQLR